MYTITLQDAPTDLPHQAQHDAEQRFTRTLERALGGPDAVLEAFRAWQAAEDVAQDEMTPDDLALAKRWIAATSKARNDGLREIGEAEAWFEVRLEKQ